MMRATTSIPWRTAVIGGFIAMAACACTTTTTTKNRLNEVSPNDASSANVDIRQREAGGPSDARKRAAIRLQLAVGYYQGAQFSTALDELKQALTIDPNFADAYTVLALVYTELHQNDLAEQSFNHALQLEPDNSDVNNNYGWYLCQNGRERESLAYFERALKNPLYTQKAKPLQNAGVCANKMGNAALAEDYFRRSFEIDPSGSVAAYNLALIYFGRKDLTRARFYVNQVNSGTTPTAASLWLGARIERRLGNKTNETALENQLERLFADSREAQMQRRGNYDD
jgi:type IV pilus assembly protein PilF